MPDVLDYVSSTEAKLTEMAIADQLKRSRKNATKESEEFCLNCGDEIPQARRNASPGCQYCIECQSLADRGIL